MEFLRYAVLTPGYVSAGLILLMAEENADLNVVTYDADRLQLEQQQIINGVRKAGVEVEIAAGPTVEEQMKKRARDGYSYDIPTASRPWIIQDCIVQPLRRHIARGAPINRVDPTEVAIPAKTQYEKQLFYSGAPHGKRVRWRFPIITGEFSKRDCIEAAKSAGITSAREVPLTRTGFWSDPWRTIPGWKKLWIHRREKYKKAMEEEMHSYTSWTGRGRPLKDISQEVELSK